MLKVGTAMGATSPPATETWPMGEELATTEVVYCR
jgi:hypothetical protein